MNRLQVVSNEVFGQLQVIEWDGKVYFPATDCAKMLGYSNTKDAIKRHCRWVAKHDLPHPQNEKKVIQKNFIPEGDLYRLIAKSQLPAAEQFERWVFDEVLPDIRKHGMYASESLLDDILKNPDLGIKLFTEYKEAKEEAKKLKLANTQQKQIIGELQPKASYYDLVLQNKSVVPISIIAKDYGLSARKLNAILHELDVQFKMGKTWLLYQKYAEMGYTQSKTHAIDAERNVMHTYWTQKGRLFLYELLKRKKGLVPLIERSTKSA
ncbi:phage antirepressor [Cytobacillus sp. NCCP-133]|uniref:phage antirepressor n=1 Tax=Cytobacillus sp. NCCP-133 TaxID=766848 RepID=UPI00222EC9AD|nr:phage antirepressor KilAC domain-containing protein [Cytobacillus sp. NCCP-133]GLB61764.1 phage antirepressor KilAC domain-containing protein [Cytobacillus sp. NCCP-133]